MKLSKTYGTKFEYRAALSGTLGQRMVQKWISAQLLASAESGSARTFLVCNVSERKLVANKKYDDSGTLETTSKPILVSSSALVHNIYGAPANSHRFHCLFFHV